MSLTSLEIAVQGQHEQSNCVIRIAIRKVNGWHSKKVLDSSVQQWAEFASLNRRCLNGVYDPIQNENHGRMEHEN